MDMHTRESNSELEQLYAQTLPRLEKGSIIKGKIIAVKDEGVVVDVQYKSEGIIPAFEFSSDDLVRLKEGDDIEVLVERINESEEVVTLSRDRALKIRAMETLMTAFNDNAIVEGRVVDKTKGGLVVDVMGIRAFLPASQVDIKGVKDLSFYIGQQFPLRILKMTQQRGYGPGPLSQSSTALIVSRRVLLEEERAKKKEETLQVLHEGATLSGAVKNITDYGVFVDLGGIDGLLHISDISWRRVNHPSEFFSIGEQKEFLILKYDEETKKVTLGYKQKKEDPWLTVDQKYSVGMKLKGTVVTIADYGIFVEVDEGLEGLIHISELDWASRPKHPSKYATIGDEIETLVINVNKGERRLSLSLKQLSPRPWELVAERYKTGDVAKGKVKTLTDFGAFVRLQEGVDGLIHISDMSWTKHIKHPSELLKKGQRVEAVVLSVEPDKERMALGLKQLTPDPWQDIIPAKFKLGDEFKGKVIKVADFGIFVELEDGVEGLVYSSEIDSSQDLHGEDEVWVRIIKLNLDDRKIGLSMKNVKEHES